MNSHANKEELVMQTAVAMCKLPQYAQGFTASNMEEFSLRHPDYKALSLASINPVLSECYYAGCVERSQLNRIFDRYKEGCYVYSLGSLLKINTPVSLAIAKDLVYQQRKIKDAAYRVVLRKKAEDDVLADEAIDTNVIGVDLTTKPDEPVIDDKIYEPGEISASLVMTSSSKDFWLEKIKTLEEQKFVLANENRELQTKVIQLKDSLLKAYQKLFEKIMFKED
jgi:hypothetical protein